MKLAIKKKYFEEIKAGRKHMEFRDAHITFICEKTGEKLVKKIVAAAVIKRPPELYPDVLSDDKIVAFELGEMDK
jgi:ASC-1-like (ASCH) protein